MAGFIAGQRLALTNLEDAFMAYCRVSAVPPAPAQAVSRRLTARVAAGSLEDRILGLAKAPTTLAQLVESAGARKPDVKAAVKRLIAAERLTLTGRARGARYQVR